MPSYQVSVPHGLGRETARARVSGFLDDVQRDHAEHIRELQSQWCEDTLAFSFVAKGLAIRGSLVVEDVAVAVSGSLPLAAALFRGQIERTIREELRRLLT